MMKAMKKTLSLLLALAMCLSLMPGMALAEEALPEAPSSDTAEITTETVSLSVTDSDDPDFIEEGEFVFPENATSPITVGEESVGSDEYEPEGEPSELGGDDALLDFGEDLPYDPEEPVDFDGDGEELELEVDTGDDGSLGGIGGANINVSTRERCLSKISGLGLPIRFENAPKGAKIKIVVMKDLLHTSNVVTCSLSAISSNGSATLTIRPANVGTGYVVIFLCNKLGIPYDIKQIKVNVSDSHIHWAGYVDDITVRVGATQTLYFYGEGFPGVSEIAVSSGNKDAFTAEPQPASVVSRTPIRITGKKVGSGQFRVDYRAKSTGDVLDVKYVNVTVLPPEIPKVRLSTSYITVEPGQTKTVALSCSGYSGSYYYRFSSSNAEAYTCGWQGSGTLTVKGNQVGSGTVTVYLMSAFFLPIAQAQLTVTVARTPVISASAASVRVTSGKTTSVNYTISDLAPGSTVTVDNPRSDLVTTSLSQSAGKYFLSLVGRNPGSTTLTLRVRDSRGTELTSRSLSVTVDPAPPTIKASASSVTVSAGGSSTVKVTYGNCSETVTVSASRTNSNVTWTWGSWSGSTIPLEIKGVNPGTTAVTVQLLRVSDRKVLATTSFNVKVDATTDTRIPIGRVGWSFGNYIATPSLALAQRAYSAQRAQKVYDYAVEHHLMNGVCYGMATSGGLIYMNEVPAGGFGRGQVSAIQKNDKNNSINLTAAQFIELMHVAQMSTTRTDNNGIDATARAIMTELDNGRLVFVGMSGSVKDEKGKIVKGGHRVTAFGYKLNGNTLTASIYDPNSPNVPKTMTFTRPSASSAFNTWSFPMGSHGTWSNTDKNGAIRYSTSANIRAIWQNMGSLTPAKLQSVENDNLVITSEPDFTLYTVDFDAMTQQVVAKVEGGALIECADGVQEAWYNEPDAESRVYMFWVPGDYYFVEDGTPDDGLAISIVGETVSTTIETDKSNNELGAMGFCAEDDTQTAEAAVSLADGAAYTISIGSTDENGASRTISKEGIGMGSVVTLGLSGDTISLGAAEDSADVTVTTPVNKCEIVAEATEGGAVTPAGATMLEAGENLLVRITPDDGWTVDTVYVDGEDVGPVSEWYFETVDSSHTLLAVFQRDLSDFTVTLQQTSFAYDGQEKTPAVTVTDSEGNELTELVDYIVAYDNNVDPGRAEALVMAVPGGAFSGVKRVSFKIEGGYIESADADDEAITVTMSSEAPRGTLFAAAYDEDGRILWIGQQTVDGTVKFELSEPLPDTATVRLFLVDGTTSPCMTPYEVDR